MQIAAQDLEYDTDQVDGYANNEYIVPEDPHPDEFEDDGGVKSTYVKNITSEFNISTTSTTIKDLKVEDIFESKI